MGPSALFGRWPFLWLLTRAVALMICGIAWLVLPICCMWCPAIVCVVPTGIISAKPVVFGFQHVFVVFLCWCYRVREERVDVVELLVEIFLPTSGTKPEPKACYGRKSRIMPTSTKHQPVNEQKKGKEFHHDTWAKGM